MVDKELLAAIKAGMKGEIDSVTTYSQAAEAASGEVQAFFVERADEEKKHYNWLLEYYKTVSDGGSPERDLSAGDDAAKSPIITEGFLKRIGSSRQLSAALSTAVLLEESGRRHYAKAADATSNPALKAFYTKLVAWETHHFQELVKIQEESERFFWDANNWEPF